MEAASTEAALQRRPRRSRRRRPRLESLLTVLVPLGVLAVWEVLSRLGVLDERTLPPPSTVIDTLWQMIENDDFLTDIGYTVARLAVGTIVGVVPGIVIGLLMGSIRGVRLVLQPLVDIFYPLPRIALFPIILILVGLNEQSNILMIALGPFFIMVITTTTAVRDIEPIYLEVAKSFKTRRLDLYRRVILPAALPIILGGLRVALGYALVAVTAVEFLVADRGLGHVIWQSWTILALDQSLAGLVTAGLIGLTAFVLLDRAERRLLPWQ
jgi:ABC-type nitrate/sulfonate/bicarbonate transport system permease component